MKEIDQNTQKQNEIMDIRLDFEGKLDKKDELIRELMEEIAKLRDEIKGKDQAIRALSDTLLEKGMENQRLSEAVNEIKNHHLATSILGQKFRAQKIGTIKYDDVTVIYFSLKSYSLGSCVISREKTVSITLIFVIIVEKVGNKYQYQTQIRLNQPKE